MRLPRQLWALILLVLALLSAQSTGLIVGVIQDSSGGVIPAAEVRAVNELTGLVWTAQSDSAGRFSIPRLPVGNYRVEVTRTGFRQFRSEPFRLDADQSRQVTVTLELGQISEQVTVAGTVSEVETVGATLRQVVDERRITELPLNGRNPLQLLLVVPGRNRRHLRPADHAVRVAAGVLTFRLGSLAVAAQNQAPSRD